ncbi:MAG: hypothetical protein A2V62_06285 [Nitrospirae bacterium RBG_19FT_COMBO_58_9]|nr:MAG: hypothetical protein A2V62_06285 [Nitrospirae bacterium RBG_19FT_COMBO_58_9]
MFESRVILDESLSWVTPTAAENVCRRIKRAGFNVLMPNVWHGRGTSWPSALAPWDSYRLTEMARNTPGFDPLDTLVQTAARHKIEVHPWFNVMLRQRELFSEFYDKGTPVDSFDVHRQDFRDFIVGLMVECVSRYPVHGINLDYIRAVSISQSAHCVEDYRRETGRNLLVDRLSWGVSTTARDAIAQWQEKAVEDIVRRVSQQVRRMNRSLVVSMSAHPGHPDLYIQGQNSMKWADEGLIDVIYNMHYEAVPDWQSIQALQSQMKRPEAMVVLCGNYETIGPAKTVVSRDANSVSDLLEKARSIGGRNGGGLYIYSMLDDRQVAALQEGAFRIPAQPYWDRALRSAVKAPEGLTVR